MQALPYIPITSLAKIKPCKIKHSSDNPNKSYFSSKFVCFFREIEKDSVVLQMKSMNFAT